jgi:DNA-binding beta-propeller fold protein YncE
VYVADVLNHRIQKFSSSGSFITKWGSQGEGNGQFDYPGGVATDPAGNVYVADMGNHRIQKFSSTGSFITKWGNLGTADGQFYGVDDGIATDASGNVYVADYSGGDLLRPRQHHLGGRER